MDFKWSKLGNQLIYRCLWIWLVWTWTTQLKKNSRVFKIWGKIEKNSFHREREFMRLLWRLKLNSIGESLFVRLSVQSLPKPQNRVFPPNQKIKFFHQNRKLSFLTKIAKSSFPAKTAKSSFPIKIIKSSFPAKTEKSSFPCRIGKSSLSVKTAKSSFCQKFKICRLID